jgi:S-(hydroxymethyl)glutathione dehydrogenase/alcohol dehydrogenase
MAAQTRRANHGLMRAAVLDQLNTQLTIADLAVDSPTRGEVLVRVVASGVCHSDVHIIDGTLSWPLPAVLGHEVAGVVEAIGADVADVKVGDHVVMCTSSFCGRCRYCMEGRTFICQRKPWFRAPGQPARISRDGEPISQQSGLGGWAEMVLVSETAVVVIDREMPLDVAALLGCGAVTGLGAVFNRARVELGSTVAVIGCGGVGLNVVQASSLANARMIIAVDVSDQKLKAAMAMGATHTVDASAGDPVAAVKDLSGGGVDHSFEVIGRPATVAQAFEMLAVGGTTTVVGVVPFDAIVPVKGSALWGEKRLQFTNMGSNRFRLDIPNYIALYQAGRLKLDELISHRIKLEDVNHAVAALRTPGDVIRSVIIFDEG